MTYYILEMRRKHFFFKFDLVDGGTRSFGETFWRQGIDALYPFSRSNPASTNGFDKQPLNGFDPFVANYPDE